MAQPLWAHTPNEVRYYLMVTSCADCGHGPLVPGKPRPAGEQGAGEGGAARRASVQTRCRHCGTRRTFHFRWDHDVAADAEGADGINPTDQPSRIVDLAQWVSLHWLLAESARSDPSPAGSRALGRQASLCLAEALKFFADGELPPPSAFFCEASRAAYRENPANYAHTPLRELQAMLPAPARHDSTDAAAAQNDPHAWWRFWEK